MAKKVEVKREKAGQLDKEVLLKLLELTNQDEIVHINLIQSTLNLFTGINIAIIGGAILINNESNDIMIKNLSLLVSGLLVYAISSFATQAFSSNYRRQIEAIAKRGKIEDLLNLDSTRFYGKAYWKHEGLIIKRHLEARKEYNSKEEFIVKNSNKGYYVIVNSLFRIFKLIGFVLILLGVYNIFYIG